MANNPGGEIRSVRRTLPNFGEIHMSGVTHPGIPFTAAGADSNVFSTPYSLSTFRLTQEDTGTNDLNLRNLVYGAPIFSKFNSDGTVNSNNSSIPVSFSAQRSFFDYYNGNNGGQMFGCSRSAITVYGFVRYLTEKWEVNGTRTSSHWGFSLSSEITNQLNYSVLENQSDYVKPAPITDGRIPRALVGEDENSQPGAYSEVLYVHYTGTTFSIGVAGEWDYNTESDVYPLPQAFIMQLSSPGGIITTRFSTNDSNCTLSFPARPNNGGPSTKFTWTSVSNPFKSGSTELLPLNSSGSPSTAMNFIVMPVR